MMTMQASFRTAPSASSRQPTAPGGVQRTTGRAQHIELGSERTLRCKPDACACGGTCPRCRAVSTSALTIGAADDRHEREADALADRVMRMADDAPAALQRLARKPQPAHELAHVAQQSEGGPV
jgi:hypothetical protein